jgi:pyruvate/2-oxoglutarate dehydrogenase complex dihydrolipoamide acyltransferase (E2) component
LMIRLRLYRDGVERDGGYTLSSFAQTGRVPGHVAIDAGWRNLIVTPDVSLDAQRARHASAPATRRAARAAGERSAAVQGAGRAAAAGSAGRPADARSDAAGCGPSTFLRREPAAKVAASMGWSASISASICEMTLLAVSINARCAGPMAACRRCGLHGPHRPCLQRTNVAS